MTTSREPTERFRTRADAYVRARPGYPKALFDFLENELGMASGQTAVELGSGTGIFARYLLDRGLRTLAVEPNAAMREAAESALSHCESFASVAATAERTGLDDAYCDWVFAAQAFHWFDVEAVTKEVRRLLRPGGRCVLIWNQRQFDASPFLRAYEAFLRRWGTDYESVAESYERPESIARVLGADYRSRAFENHQDLNLAGLEARIFSSSYMPDEDSDQAEEMRSALREMFDAHAENGLVRIEYATKTYWSKPMG